MTRKNHFVVAALAATALAPLPAFATLPTTGLVMGLANRLHYLNDTILGRTGLKAAYRGKSPAAACYSTLQLYYMDGDGYAAGTGGIARVHFETTDANSKPTGTWIGSASSSWAPGFANGQRTAGQDSHYLFHTHTFTPAVCLDAGQKFALVFENTDPDPADNWVSVDAMTADGPGDFPAHPRIWAVLMWDGSSWVLREPPYSRDTPTLTLCTAAGDCPITQTYMQAGPSVTLGAATKVRQLLTPPASATTQTCHLDLSRTSSSTTTTRVGLTDVTGTFLSAGTAYQDVDISALPVTSTGLAGRQVDVTLPAPVPVTAGIQVALQVSGAGVALAPAQDGVGYFSHTGGWGGSVDYAQVNTGSGWTGWDGTLDDLSAYCDLTP